MEQNTTSGAGPLVSEKCVNATARVDLRRGMPVQYKPSLADQVSVDVPSAPTCLAHFAGVVQFEVPYNQGLGENNQGLVTRGTVPGNLLVPTLSLIESGLAVSPTPGVHLMPVYLAGFGAAFLPWPGVTGIVLCEDKSAYVGVSYLVLDVATGRAPLVRFDAREVRAAGHLVFVPSLDADAVLITVDYAESTDAVSVDGEDMTAAGLIKSGLLGVAQQLQVAWSAEEPTDLAAGTIVLTYKTADGVTRTKEFSITAETAGDGSTEDAVAEVVRLECPEMAGTSAQIVLSTTGVLGGELLLPEFPLILSSRAAGEADTASMTAHATQLGKSLVGFDSGCTAGQVYELVVSRLGNGTLTASSAYDPSAAGKAEAGKAMTLDGDGVFNADIDEVSAVFAVLGATNSFNLLTAAGANRFGLNVASLNRQYAVGPATTGASAQPLDSNYGSIQLAPDALSATGILQGSFLVKVDDAAAAAELTLSLYLPDSDVEVFSTPSLPVMAGDTLHVEYVIAVHDSVSAYVRWRLSGNFDGSDVPGSWVDGGPFDFDLTEYNEFTPMAQWNSADTDNIAHLAPGHNAFIGG